MAGSTHRATTATAAVVQSTQATASPATGTQFSRRSRGEAS